ncbi:hypothetical protein FXV91_08860 [Methanosarcina sp. DH2]|jgi:hypothetical protein|uniref:hypothetical protein n=1 Tax=Methanosarcina sp. DH2 TaxID=2605639 RepID=UPI001E413FCD|nr:hypothetical protein [Methanosarcina sp. DH2]MCC4770295.1 hypothetical protein [Methanosarcina sp. DH2]
MNKLMEIVVYILAVIGLTCVVKHIRIMPCGEGCCMCGWHKTKVEGSKTKVEGLKTKVEGLKTKVEEFKTKIHGEKRTGSRYGSDPVRY